MDIRNLVFNRNSMLIISYLSKNRDREKVSSHIAKDLNISVGSVHTILKQLENVQIVSSRKVGKSVIYEVEKHNSMIKSFRVFENLLELKGLISLLKEYSRKIILFGSCSDGEDTFESDIDLFIVADEEQKDIIFELISNYQLDREINPVIIDMIEFMELENEEPVFYREIMKGIEVWEGSDEVD